MDQNKNSVSPGLRATSETSAPVSFNSSLNDLEAITLHRNITRVCMRSQNASHTFAVNPLFENMQSSDYSSQDIDPQLPQINTYQDLEFNSLIETQILSVNNNDDLLRLNIPNRPETVEINFETLSRLRNSKINSIKSFNKLMRNKSDLNSFGGSLRVKSNNSIIW